MGQRRGGRVRAILFDLDGTLYPTRRAAVRSWPLFVRYATLFLAFRQVRVRVRSIRPIKDLHALQARLVADRLRIDPAAAQSLIEDVVYTRLPKHFHGVKPHCGLTQVLLKLSEHGAKLGVLSDLPPYEKLDHIGLTGFDCVVTSESTHYLKPNPEPFRYAAERLELQPAQVLYVGNHYRYDILGARVAGMLTAHRAPRQERGSRADLTFSRYDRLLAAIDAAGIKLPVDRG